MVKIKVASKVQTDVTDMRAKGWDISIYRDGDAAEEMITVKKKDVRFTVKPKFDENGRFTEVRKYVNGYQKDSKLFYDPGNCGINGTLCISEGKTNDDTYAFFRNEALQNLLDEFGIRRVMFPRTAGDTFEKEVYLDTTKAPYSANGGRPQMPPFHTDGTYEEIKSEVKGLKKWLVTGATYIYEYTASVLTIPQVYDLNKVADQLDPYFDND